MGLIAHITRIVKREQYVIILFVRHLLVHTVLITKRVRPRHFMSRTRAWDLIRLLAPVTFNALNLTSAIQEYVESR